MTFTIWLDGHTKLSLLLDDRILFTSEAFCIGFFFKVLKVIEYNSSTKGKCENTNEIVTTGSTEKCESEKVNTEVENDQKVSFDNVKNVG